jgi:putative membrane protein
MVRKMILAGVLMGMCCLTQAAGQDERRGERRGDDAPMTAERFVLHASAGGMAEVALGKLAMTKATSGEVRKFAQQMVEDHTKANKQLMQIAESKQLPVARDMDKKHQEMERKLSEMTGEQFDREYIKGQVKDHEEAVALFTKFAENGQDADLKGFATQTLPTLKEHLKHVKDLAERMK